MILDTNNHSVFKLNYHLIFVVKYRKKVMNDAISARLQAIFETIGTRYHIQVNEWNHDVDHVHNLLTAKQNTELSKFINTYKSASSRRIKNEFPEIKESQWNKGSNKGKRNEQLNPRNFYLCSEFQRPLFSRLLD